MDQISTLSELEVIKNKFSKYYLLIHKSSSDVSQCALNHIKTATEIPSEEYGVGEVDVLKSSEIHGEFNINTVPTLVVFENGILNNVIKGCMDETYYSALLKGELSLSNIDYDSVIWYVPSLDTILCEGICDEISYSPIFDQDLCIELHYDDGCIVDTCVHLTVNFETKMFIPNIFTPGLRDGVNDYFMVKTNVYEQLKVLNFSIYDRWGGLVFHKADTYISRQTDETFGWDGTFNGEEVMAGVYVYLIEVEDKDGNILRFVGDLTLLR